MRSFFCLTACILLTALVLPLFQVTAKAEAPVDFSSVQQGGIYELKSLSAIYESGSEKANIAGLTKLAALLTICELIDEGELSMDAPITISEAAAHVSGPTAFLEAGETVAASELLKAAVMISAGDALMALAESSGMGVLTRINQRLAALGINVAYTDVIGTGIELSARELALIGGELIKSPAFLSCSTMFYEKLTHDDGRVTELASSNKLLKSCAGCIGVATGSSGEAGYCGVFAVKRADTGFICVILGAKNAQGRAASAQAALEYAFNAYKTHTPVHAGDVIVPSINVVNGTKSEIALVAQADVTLLQGSGEQVVLSVSAPEQLTAPVQAAQAVGKAIYSDGAGNLLASIELYPSEDVPLAGIKDYMQGILLLWLHA